MDIDQLKQDIVTASHILHRQGIAANFGPCRPASRAILLLKNWSTCIARSLRKKSRIERGIISAA